MTKDDIKGFLFSLAWCTWSNHHAERVLGVLKRLGFTDEEAREQLTTFEGIIKNPS